MARAGDLVRVGRGRYVRPRQTRFGTRIPSPSELVEQLAQATGETVVPAGAAAAHGLGLTTQVPVRAVISLEPEQRQRLLLACASVPSWLSRVITGALFPSERETATDS